MVGWVMIELEEHFWSGAVAAKQEEVNWYWRAAAETAPEGGEGCLRGKCPVSGWCRVEKNKENLRSGAGTR